MKSLHITFMFIFLQACSGSSDNIELKFPSVPASVVMCDSNGGVFEGGRTTVPKFSLSEFRFPVREGFLFSHWNSERDGSGDRSMTFINSSKYGERDTEDIMMYAQWTPTDGSFNVVLESRLPVELEIRKDLPKDSVINLPDNSEYTMDGYTLSGWVEPGTYTLQTGTYTVTETVTLFAVWKRDTLPEKCSLLLSASGGRITGVGSSHTGAYPCGLIDLSILPSAEKSGYTLKGWYSSLTNLNGGFYYPYPGQYMLEDSRSWLYAVWEED